MSLKPFCVAQPQLWLFSCIPYTMTSQGLPFEVWKLRLRDDCERQDKLLAYKNLGEDCLKILWETGTEPSVEGIVNGGARTA